MTSNKLIRETTGNNTIDYCYSLDKLVGFRYNNNVTYIYERNILGDVVRIYDLSNSNLVAEYDYDSWGNVTVTNFTSDNIGTINNVSEKTLGKMFAVSFLYLVPFTAFNSAFTILNMKG